MSTAASETREPHGRALLAPDERKPGLAAGARMSLLFAFLASVLALFTASQASIGTVFVGIACLFGIIARIAQAEAHHRRLTD